MSDKPTIQVGRQDDTIMLAINGKPAATFSPAEAAALATLLIKHAALISSGCKLVDKALDETYGNPEQKLPVDKPLN